MNHDIPLKFWTWYKSLKSFKSNNKVSFNKPLTILFALASVYKGNRWIDFESDGDSLNNFLSTFSKFNTDTSCLYPLWRLRNDNKDDLIFWLTSPNDLEVNNSGDIKISEAKEKKFKAGFSEEFYTWLRAEPWRCMNFIEKIIDATFTETYEELILNELQLFDQPIPQKTGQLILPENKTTRDPNFRNIILTAFDNRCAFCDLKVLLSNKPIAMEAAHIKWKAYGGLCSSNNGLCLCPTHHTTLDLGVWTLDNDYRIVLSKDSLIDYRSDVFFSKFEGVSIKDKVMRKGFLPDQDNLKWHQDNIFRN